MLSLLIFFKLCSFQHGAFSQGNKTTSSILLQRKPMQSPSVHGRPGLLGVSFLDTRPVQRAGPIESSAFHHTPKSILAAHLTPELNSNASSHDRQLKGRDELISDFRRQLAESLRREEFERVTKITQGKKESFRFSWNSFEEANKFSLRLKIERPSKHSSKRLSLLRRQVSARRSHQLRQVEPRDGSDKQQTSRPLHAFRGPAQSDRDDQIRKDGPSSLPQLGCVRRSRQERVVVTPE